MQTYMIFVSVDNVKNAHDVCDAISNATIIKLKNKSMESTMMEWFSQSNIDEPNFYDIVDIVEFTQKFNNGNDTDTENWAANYIMSYFNVVEK